MSASDSPTKRGREREQKRHRDHTADGDARSRAVSEVLSFVFTFSMIALMVGVVYVGGVTQLQRMHDDAAVDSTERGFETLSRNVQELRKQGAPSRVTSIELAGGALRIGNATTFNVTLVGEGEWYTVVAEPIAYRSERGARLRYVNGAVLRTDTGGTAWMVSRPPVVVGDRTVIPFVQTRASGAQSVGGDSTVQIRTRLTNRELFGTYREAGQYTVRFNVTSPRAAAWKRYLSEQGADCSLTGDTTSCTWEAESVRLSLATVDVETL